MTGEEYSNLKQGDKVVVNKEELLYLRDKGTIYEMVYRDHYREAIYLQYVKPVGENPKVGSIKIVDPSIAIQFLDVYKDNIGKKELNIPVDFNVGDEFWIMKDNRPISRKIDRIDINIDKDGICVLYESGISFYNPNSIYHTKQELFNSFSND